MTKLVKWGTFAAVLALALAAFGGAATAKKKKQEEAPPPPAPGPVVTVTNTGTIPKLVGTPASTTLKAACPPGTQLIGGGYTPGDPPATNPGDQTNVTGSRRVGLATWAVSGSRVAPTDGTMTVEAYCRANISRLSEVTETAALNTPTGGEFAAVTTVTASCPSGERAVAGGFVSGFLGLPPTGLIESRRTAAGDGWVVSTLSSPFPGVSSDLSATAYCTTGDVYEVTGSADGPAGDPVPPFGYFTASATGCPAIQVEVPKTTKKKKKHGKKKGGKKIAVTTKKGKKKKKKKTETETTTVQTQPVSGGFSSSPVINALPTPNLTSAYDQFRTSTGWQARGLHIGTERGTVTAEAYCMA